jgi:hypothetical protein
MNNGNPLTMLDLIMICPEKGAERIEALIKRIAELELSIKDLIEEFAEASCMGDLAKIARNYGYEESKDEY